MLVVLYLIFNEGYVPTALAVNAREIPVAVFVTVTLASPTTAPEESVTEPRILPW